MDVKHWSETFVEEFVYHATHDRMIDWLLPGVPPSGKKLSIPMVAVVNIRGDRLCHGIVFPLMFT